MKEGLLGDTLQVSIEERAQGGPTSMLHAGLDLSRNRIDVCLMSEHGEVVAEFATPSDADGVGSLARRVLELGEPVRGDAHVLAVLSERDLVPEIWLPDPRVRREREQARFRMHLVHHKSSLKNRIHSTLITFGHSCPGTALFGVAGRELLDPLDVPQPWRGTVDASLRLIDDLEAQIGEINKELRAGGADHPYIPLLLTVPGIGWVLAFTIAAEIGDITRFPSPKKVCGYTGLCPRVIQSGDRDRRGPLTKQGPKYLRWAMLEATMHASRHPIYRERYQRNKQRLGKQRGAKVAQIDIARKLTEANWHMLTTTEPFG